MQITFKINKLKKQYEKFEEAEKAYGEQVARKYIQRLNIIDTAKNIDELKSILTLRCHELSGKRKGEWSIRLTGNMRLIFTLHCESLQIARIEEVSKHYD